MSEIDEDVLRRQVVSERRTRGLLSGRAAALAAQAKGASISYTTWNDWESGTQSLGDRMTLAVAALFDWKVDWPQRPLADRPAERSVTQRDDDPTLADLDRKLEQLLELVHGMGVQLERLVLDEVGPEDPAPPRSRPAGHAHQPSADPTDPVRRS